MALSVEASELCEIFQWLNEKQVETIHEDEGKMAKIKDEIADVFFYTSRLAFILGVDLEKAYWNKMEKNAKKYPVNLAKGNANKYTDF
jgi:NTP pyrophosphatase (non-canonical NTP hydrolase)